MADGRFIGPTPGRCVRRGTRQRHGEQKLVETFPQRMDERRRRSDVQLHLIGGVDDLQKRMKRFYRKVCSKCFCLLYLFQSFTSSLSLRIAFVAGRLNRVFDILLVGLLQRAETPFQCAQIGLSQVEDGGRQLLGDGLVQNGEH